MERSDDAFCSGEERRKTERRRKEVVHQNDDDEEEEEDGLLAPNVLVRTPHIPHRVHADVVPLPPSMPGPRDTATGVPQEEVEMQEMQVEEEEKATQKWERGAGGGRLDPWWEVRSRPSRWRSKKGLG